MNKRLVVILCCFFVISIVLLGASFAQESGQDKVLSTTQDVSDNMRVIYSSKTVNKDNKVIDLSIINKSNNIKDYGLGTEKLEEELNKLFKAKIVRMDMDTTSRKGMHEKIINDFGEHKYDILVGTQMIAKSLDFPLVTLVGVINADSSLNIPDFRSAETTFQLLSQVSGRAGRSEKPGEVVIQTYNPDHYSIRYAKNHDYLSFYKEEMAIRRELCYCPYFYLVVVNITSKEYELGFKEANKIGEYLRKNLSKETIVLGPSMANVFRINNVYHYQCIIKYKRDDKLKMILREIDNIYKVNNKVDVDVDVDPVRI